MVLRAAIPRGPDRQGFLPGGGVYMGPPGGYTTGRHLGSESSGLLRCPIVDTEVQHPGASFTFSYMGRAREGEVHERAYPRHPGGRALRARQPCARACTSTASPGPHATGWHHAAPCRAPTLQGRPYGQAWYVVHSGGAGVEGQALRALPAMVGSAHVHRHSTTTRLTISL